MAGSSVRLGRRGHPEVYPIVIFSGQSKRVLEFSCRGIPLKRSRSPSDELGAGTTERPCVEGIATVLPSRSGHRCRDLNSALVRLAALHHAREYDRREGWAARTGRADVGAGSRFGRRGRTSALPLRFGRWAGQSRMRRRPGVMAATSGAPTSMMLPAGTARRRTGSDRLCRAAIRGG